MKNSTNIEYFDNYAIVTMVGDFHSIEDAEQIRETFKEVHKKGFNNILINLKEVFFLNSPVMGSFLSGNAIVNKAGGNFVVFNANDYVENLFAVMKLDLVFSICKTLEKALDKIK